MSRRFGRNQKRRMREELARAAETQAKSADELARWQLAYRREQGLLESVKLKRDVALDELAYLVRSIAEICPESALLPPGAKLTELQIGFQNNLEGVFRYSLPQPVPVATARGDMAPDRYSVQTVDLHKFVVAISQNPLEFTRAVHMIVADRGDLAYYVSDGALKHQLAHPHVLEHFVRQAVGELSEALHVVCRETIRNRNCARGR